MDGATVQKDLWPASAISTIKEIFTFATDTLDLLSTGGSVVAQKGSSGGGVFSMATGKLIGIVVTSSDEGSTGDRDLRAITLSHINRSMFGDTGMDLNAFLSGGHSRASKELSGNARRHYAPDIVRCFKQVSTHARVFADVIHMGNIMSASLLI